MSNTVSNTTSNTVYGFVDVPAVRAAVAAACGIPAAAVRLDAGAVRDLVRSACASSSARTYWYDGVYPVDDSRAAAQGKYLAAVGAVSGVRLRGVPITGALACAAAAVVRAARAAGVSPSAVGAHLDGLDGAGDGIDVAIAVDLLRFGSGEGTVVLLGASANLAAAIAAAADGGKTVVVLALGDADNVPAQVRALADVFHVVYLTEVAGLHASSASPPSGPPTAAPVRPPASRPHPSGPKQSVGAAAALSALSALSALTGDRSVAASSRPAAAPHSPGVVSPPPVVQTPSAPVVPAPVSPAPLVQTPSAPVVPAPVVPAPVVPAAVSPAAVSPAAVAAVSAAPAAPPVVPRPAPAAAPAAAPVVDMFSDMFDDEPQASAQTGASWGADVFGDADR